jgi:hypothetical protein
VTYLSELRSSLVDAAHRERALAAAASARPDSTGRHERSFSLSLWARSMHGGRAILVSFALGLTGTAVGVVQVGAPLGPEPQISPALTRAVASPPSGEPSP